MLLRAYDNPPFLRDYSTMLINWTQQQKNTIIYGTVTHHPRYCIVSNKPTGSYYPLLTNLLAYKPQTIAVYIQYRYRYQTFFNGQINRVVLYGNGYSLTGATFPGSIQQMLKCTHKKWVWVQCVYRNYAVGIFKPTAYGW